MRALSTVLILTSCAPPWQDEPLEKVCDDVGFAVAAASFRCSADEEEAQAAFDAYQERLSCRMETIHQGNVEGVPFEVYYTCVDAVNHVPCDDYEAFAADDFAGLEDWMGLAPACATLLARSDGTRLPVEEP